MKQTLIEILGFWIAYCLAVYVFVVRRSRREATKRTQEETN